MKISNRISGLVTGATLLAAVTLTPSFAEAATTSDCVRIGNQMGVVQYNLPQSIKGFQESRGIGCEYTALNGQFRATAAYDLNNNSDARRFYNNWQRAETTANRHAENLAKQRSRDPLGLNSVNNGARSIDRTLRTIDSLGRTLERILN